MPARTVKMVAAVMVQYGDLAGQEVGCKGVLYYTAEVLRIYLSGHRNAGRSCRC